MKHSIQILLLGSALLSMSACGSSKGPGEIGSRDDIVIRNAGDPEPVKAAMAQGALPASQAAIDPIVAEHQKAVAEAQGEIEDVAAADTDDTPVPGEPVTKPVSAPAEQDVPPSAPQVAEPAPEPMPEKKVAEPVDLKTAEPIDAVEQEVAAKPMARAEMDMIKPMEPRTMTAPAPAPVAEPAVEAVSEAVVETVTDIPVEAPVAAGMQPVIAGDPAVSADVMQKTVTDPVAQTAPVAVKPSVSANGLISNPDANLIMNVQKALADKGYYFGAADGALGAETLNALHLYQNAHGMSDFGVNAATLEKLGVSY